MLDSFNGQPFPEFLQAAFRIAMNAEDESLISELVQLYQNQPLGVRCSIAGIMASHPGNVRELIALSLLPLENSLLPVINLLACVNVSKLRDREALINSITQLINTQSSKQMLKAKPKRRLRIVAKRISLLTSRTDSLQLLHEACSQASGDD
jgi:hypothetical protein